NSAVKRGIADGSVGSPHVRVGHRQASNPEEPQSPCGWGFFVLPGFAADRGKRDLAIPSADAAAGSSLLSLISSLGKNNSIHPVFKAGKAYLVAVAALFHSICANLPEPQLAWPV
ncbi:hypothetical protein K6T12_19635, partial [Marinobacterium sp. CAU 1594]|uniref:hypothetical protein n=1 Tax=Marinobacterium arenosum TaxID=2862496 RepID=UPI001C961BA2